MPDTITTAQLQQWMTTVITGYGQLNNKLHKAYEEHALLAAEVVQKNEIAGIADRLSVYTNGYVARLLECLSADYPVVQQFTGTEAFHHFAAAYLQWKPSASHTLYDLGKLFPQFLERSRPVLPDLSEDQEISLQLPAALALLERARQEAILDIGTEGTDDQQLTIGLEDLLFSAPVLKTPPCLRLLTLPFPILPVYNALQADQEYKAPQLQVTYMAVSRKNYRLVMEEITDWQFTFLGFCQETTDLASAVQKTADCCEIAADALLAELYIWLPLLQQKGFVTVTL